MNKKFITLCVSALLAGGMATPVFAQVSPANIMQGATEIAGVTAASVVEGEYYLIKLDDRTGSYPTYSDSWSLQATKAAVSHTDADEVNQYNLWKVEWVKVNGSIPANPSFKLVNKAGLYLGATAATGGGYDLVPNGKYQEFKWTSRNGKDVLVLAQINYAIAQNGNDYVLVDANGSATDVNCETGFFLPAVDELSISELNAKFLSSFTIGIGYYKDNVWQDYAEKHDLKGNVFAGDLKATDNIGDNITGWKQELNQTSGIDNEVYLMNGDKVVVLTNTKWSGLNNSLAGTGYKFTLMTPYELAKQEAADADLVAAGKQPVIRSYVFKVTSPNVVVEEALEVAVKVYNYSTFTDWEELYVSEVDGNYYLTTAEAANSTTSPATDIRTLQKADYANNDSKVYVRFTDNNFVDAENFFSYAWNIVRVNDDKAMNPADPDAWQDAITVAKTAPEGQWILRENDNKDGYIWVNRETKEVAPISFASLRYTEDANVYRVEVDDAVAGTTTQYYKITKAKNAAGVEINLDAYDEFDYYGAGVKSNSTGVDNTYKIQFTSDLTGDPIYIGMDGVGTLLLTKDPAAAVNFEADTVKTTDNAVIVVDEDYNANNDVFRIFNTYIGKNEKNEWIDKTDTVSFYRYNFMHDGKYLHFNITDNKFELVEAIANADAFVIKEKDNNDVNILNVDNNDFDAYTTSATPGIMGENPKKEVCVAGEKFLSYFGEMMYFDFNYGEARQQTNIYNWNANAQLKLDYNDYNIYRNIAPTTDTVAIYRTEYSDEFLFEKGDFLGMTYDRDGYNAALFADTAYVRNNTEKPLFMLAVRPEITPAKTYCPDHGFNTDCPAQHLDTIPGYVDADYLTSLADSAAAYAKLLDNPYLDNGKYTKLAFVGARHNVDTVTVASTGKEFTITEGLVNPMLFAFRIVNQETQDFVIETADLKDNKKVYDANTNPYVISYVRWNNGVPVLTKDITDAEVFNVKTDLKDANPTANEEIATSSVVVAGTNGAVVVKGAEGKSVIVSTILGKVVANEVLTSDNATIAAPQGVVVVSVDGESFKVVVK